ncbi:hypothetical protein J5N97_010687 [Dioscorea zingiberensis]|uniref:non-specific serine/threonine protein kinase n=1 Tax=Dioscorea zingiberensis TaxID=325984 RepID=A0A9D5D0S5_9LILI|nr:hypothetical protein J5N97_010687 [Dioscorea zingiberensis]
METSPPASPRTNHDVLLGKYVFGDILGRGSFAKVYKARAVADGATVAIKILDTEKLRSAGLNDQFMTEVNAMRRLSHPNIIRLHEVMATRSKIYLIMDLAPGGEIGELIEKRGKLPESTARRFFQQLISALHYCHSRGVSHRDIKPQNLLLDGDGNLKLADFGLSALPEKLKNGLLQTRCGTPGYVAPEVCGGGGYDGAKADAWSCGVVLYVLIAGRLPFVDLNRAIMFHKMFKRGYSFPPWFPKDARRVVDGFLDPNPATRLTIEGVLGVPWFIKRCFSLDSKLDQMDNTTPVLRRATSMNAFDIISRFKAFDLSGLFDDAGRKSEQRFTSDKPADKVFGKMRECGEKHGFVFEKTNEGMVGVGKWGCMLKIEALEVTETLLMVDIKEQWAVKGCHQLTWEGLRKELGDIVLTWVS